MKDTDAGPIVIFGGRSEIGLEMATRLAPGATVLLAARRADKLDDEAAAVRAAGATAVYVREFDADDLASHAPLVESIVAEHGPIRTAMLAFGILGDQSRAEKDPGHAAAIVHTDFVAQVSLLTVLANSMRSAGSDRSWCSRRSRGSGCAAPTMCTGRPRPALDGFCSGLADALHGSGVDLLVVRPGFVIGRMTEGMSPAPLSRTPDQVAAATVRALAKRRRTVWVPWALRPMFVVMRMLPQFVWRRMPR